MAIASSAARTSGGPTEDLRPFSVHRLGIVMRPKSDEPSESEGVTNPACVRGPDGELYLFPRLIAKGNYSRIGIARVQFDAEGNPAGVERLGIALEPTEPFERNPFSGGGCEDPRITFLEPFGRYVMTYTAFSAYGPRIAVATSRDLFTWERHGLVRFSPADSMDFNATDNKDAVIFPAILQDPRDGVPSVAMIHRPLFRGLASQHVQRGAPSRPVVARANEAQRVRHQSMWVSYCHQPQQLGQLVNLHSHHRLMSPRASWERVKIGAGTPPLLTHLGWLVIYHGVAAHEGPHRYFRYSGGVVVLDAERPERILYRSRHPLLDPRDEPEAAWPRPFVFPTGIDRRTDLGDPHRVDVYYGIADSSIGVATLRLPPTLPEPKEELDELREAPIS